LLTANNNVTFKKTILFFLRNESKTAQSKYTIITMYLNKTFLNTINNKKSTIKKLLKK
jgi:hypothetical protein